MSIKLDLVSATLRLWDSGLDTNQIARLFHEDESDVERWLHIALNERQRGNRGSPDSQSCVDP